MFHRLTLGRREDPLLVLPSGGSLFFTYIRRRHPRRTLWSGRAFFSTMMQVAIVSRRTGPAAAESPRTEVSQMVAANLPLGGAAIQDAWTLDNRSRPVLSQPVQHVHGEGRVALDLGASTAGAARVVDKG